ncbi:hypothetical protein BGW80DRAFT_1248871 [Lactifluus volemus]|nr:hypothetical protein BGW80DRAFT_1248871 [Lactifluus volemus]
MANAVSAQKAEDGKIFWVEFTPQYHAHLVKCAVVLVPHPLQKVKKVMFAYVLEILNGEAPKAFFDLIKGPSLAAKAQKEKKWENANEQLKKPLEADHNRPAKNVDSGKGGEAKGKGNSKTPATSNKPKALTKSQTTPPTHHVDPPPTSALEAAKQRAPNAHVVVAGPATYFEQPTDGTIRSWHSAWLNTTKKRGTHQRVMESVIDKP